MIRLLVYYSFFAPLYEENTRALTTRMITTRTVRTEEYANRHVAVVNNTLNASVQLSLR